MRAAQRVLETALLCAQQALGLRDIDTLFAGSLERTQIESLLENIQRDWQDKGLELVPIASAANLSPPRWLNEDLAVLVFIVFNSIG